MKNIYLSFLYVSISFLVNAQQHRGIEHLSENFSAGMPPNGWTIDNHSANWSAFNSSNAGGTAPEARLAWTPQFNGTTRLISPSINLVGIEHITLNFKHALDHYTGSYTIGAATRSGESDWNIIWSRTGVTIVESLSIPIINSDVGSNEFQFCIFFTGNTYNLNFWYIDDIVLFTPYETDLLTQSINLSKFLPMGSHTVSATVHNAGIHPISSFQIQYLINGQNAVTENVSGFSLEANTSYEHTFTQPWLANPGVYTVSVVTSNVNYQGNDNDPSNNSLSQSISIASQTTANRPLIEVFTSSTSPPCNAFNTSILNPFIYNQSSELSVIKYQMNWPGVGDSYYTSEGGVRRVYYGVTTLPKLFIGGESVPTTSDEIENSFNNHLSKESFFEINASSYVDGSTLHSTIEVMPYITASGFKLRCALVENVTTGNVGSNGETEFYYVLMKMLPNASGTEISFVDGQPSIVSFTESIATSNIENTGNLSLVVFIQNDESKEVFQSTMVRCGSQTDYQAKIESFGFIEPVLLNVEISDVVNNSASIYVTVAYGTNIASLTPTITVSQGALISPAPVNSSYSPINFTNPVAFTVTSPNGLTVNTFTVNVEMYIPFYNVTFNVTDFETNAPITGATIGINNEVLVTNNAGNAVISLSPGTYNYTITKELYFVKEGSVNVSSSDINVPVQLNLAEYMVTFDIRGIEGEPINNASILINSGTVLTNEQGIASLSLRIGQYPYLVYKNGFISSEGVVNVQNEEQVVVVILTPTDINIQALPSLNIFPNPSNGTFSLRIPNIFEADRVEVVSVSGQIVKIVFINQLSNLVRISINERGFYMVSVSYKDGSKIIGKLIIE